MTTSTFVPTDVVTYAVEVHYRGWWENVDRFSCEHHAVERCREIQRGGGIARVLESRTFTREISSAVEPPTQTLAEYLEAHAADADQYETCMSLSVSEHGKSVDLRLGVDEPDYGVWIPGEGGDICLYRSNVTGKVIGAHLPFYNPKLAVFHDGPLRINEGFRKPVPMGDQLRAELAAGAQYRVNGRVGRLVRITDGRALLDLGNGVECWCDVADLEAVE